MIAHLLTTGLALIVLALWFIVWERAMALIGFLRLVDLRPRAHQRALAARVVGLVVYFVSALGTSCALARLWGYWR